MQRIGRPEGESSSPDVYEKSLAAQWHELGCATEGVPYVLHGLVAQLTNPDYSLFREHSDAAKTLASTFLDEAHCAGAHGLSEDDKATLKEIATPQAPKP